MNKLYFSRNTGVLLAVFVRENFILFFSRDRLCLCDTRGVAARLEGRNDAGKVL